MAAGPHVPQSGEIRNSSEVGYAAGAHDQASDVLDELKLTQVHGILPHCKRNSRMLPNEAELSPGFRQG
jgi:hypothetical protein